MPTDADPTDWPEEPVDGGASDRSVRPTSEEQALQLLQRTLGAEKIGEVAP